MEFKVGDYINFWSPAFGKVILARITRLQHRNTVIIDYAHPKLCRTYCGASIDINDGVTLASDAQVLEAKLLGLL